MVKQSGFELQRSHRIGSLDIDVTTWIHTPTGATHLHLATDHPENVFLVALRTLPGDSSGVAHILEHTVLCGSERFPVRDPFFLMIRRSLNTFMNAFTTSDYTAYPFASMNRKDFDNLLEIYLDAVFFPRLDPLDFAQEGHRLEFEVPADPATELVYRGVVYNEMKGDVSSPISVAFDALKKHLFPTTTYHHNSGGDPRQIPELKYDGLINFYRTHYHPANAIFITFGDRPVAELQEKFSELALSRFPEPGTPASLSPERRFARPQHAEEVVSIEAGAEVSERGQVLFGWLLGRNTDVDDLMQAQLVSDLLLDTSASPLRLALETTHLGSAPSPLCGLEESNHEMCFMCGLEGVDVDQADAVEQLVLDTLERVAEEGVPGDKIDAVLHQIELHRREIGGDGSPYGLQLMFTALPALVHGGDPIALLDLQPSLEKLREAVQDPAFVPGLVRRLLIDNPHRVRLDLRPDPDLDDRNEALLKAWLADLKNSMSADERENLVACAAALQARQETPDDLSLLPSVTLTDVPTATHTPEGTSTIVNGVKVTTYAAGTNGLVYQQVVIDLPVTPETLAVLPVFGAAITEVGSAGRDYGLTQHVQHAISGGINAYSNLRADLSDTHLPKGHFVLASRALRSNNASLAQLLVDTLTSADFTDLPRLRDLVKQMRVRRESGIAGNGHGLAMSAAAAGYAPVSALNHQLSGLAGLLALRELDDSLDQPEGLAALAHKLEQLRDSVSRANRQLLLIGEGGSLPSLVAGMCDAWSNLDQGSPAALTLPAPPHPRDQLWITNTQVSFCAQAFATVPESHADTAALAVLGGVLRNGFLHSAVREQGGAYGAGAGNDASNGVFRFYSYRDPNLLSTYDAFSNSINWVLDQTLPFALVEEAILQIVSSIDAPASPAGEARSAFGSLIHGRDSAFRRANRERILSVTPLEVQRVAATYLKGNGTRCAVTGSDPRDASFEVIHL